MVLRASNKYLVLNKGKVNSKLKVKKYLQFQYQQHYSPNQVMSVHRISWPDENSEKREYHVSRHGILPAYYRL